MRSRRGSGNIDAVTHDERSVVITGASRGIGRACALRLAASGTRVFAGVRSDEHAAALRTESDRITPVHLDVTDAAQIEAVAKRIAGEVGERGLWGLVNNAGIAIGGPLEFVPADALRHQLEVNVTGQVVLTQALLPLLRAARGRIVFVGSIAGLSALPYVGAYAASKHAIEAIADALRLELRPWNIAVAVIEPGTVATDIWSTSIERAMRILERAPPQAAQLYGKRLEAVRRRVAAGGPRGLPADAVARAVEHALTAGSPKTRYIVGRDARARRWLERLPDRVRDAAIDRQLRRL